MSANAGTNGRVTIPVAPGAPSESGETLDAEPLAVASPAASVVDAPPVAVDDVEDVAADERSGRRRRPAWMRELVIVAVVYFTYSLTRNLIPGHEEQAQRNARTILDWEKALGLDIELGINRWGAAREWLIVPVNYYYATLHLGLTLAVLIWLYRRRHDVYARCRSWLLTMTYLALACYWLYPLAPPRLMAGASYIDTAKEYVLWGVEPSEGMQSLSNQYAAMPSMHVGWALWVGAVLVLYGRSRLVRGLGVAYPIATLFVVVVTGNHFILDAVGGLVCFLAAIAIVAFAGRLRARRRELTAAR